MRQASGCLLPSNAIQLAVKNQDAPVAPVVFKPLPVIRIGRLLAQLNLFQFKIPDFTLETVAGSSHNTPWAVRAELERVGGRFVGL
jgi:hypothetical protein